MKKILFAIVCVLVIATLLFQLSRSRDYQVFGKLINRAEPETDKAIANDSQAIAQHVLDRVTPGSIILLHVMFDSRRASMESVPLIIRGLKAKGYTFVTVDELLDF